jgi:hypothetical protein
METRDIILAFLILVVGVAIFFLLDPTLGGLLKKKHEGFNNYNSGVESENNNNVLLESESNVPGVNVPTMNHANGFEEAAINNAHADTSYQAPPTPNAPELLQNNIEPMNNNDDAVEGFETIAPSPMPFKDAQKPANCYPKDQIAPQELLPNDPNSKWAQVNPQGQGDIAGKNYLSAGALIGVNTIGQSMRNANYQLRSDPPNPQVKVSIWNQSTIEPDFNRRPLEIG